LMKCGGIYQAAKLLAVAEAAGIPCILGSMGESSIGSAAGLHFVTAHPSIIACELIGPLFITNDPASGYQVEMATFRAVPSEQDGLGVQLK
jgi:L-alanine-DL-glutamate epimerase-like enolase superfamily enzyme